LKENILSHSKLLHSSKENTNLLVYMTGHGGPGFLKIQDHEALSASDITTIFQCLQGRYKKALFLADTCKAGSLLDELSGVQDLIAIVSSKDGENSYAAVRSPVLGMHLVDGFSYELGNYAAKKNIRKESVGDFVTYMIENEEKVLSEIEFQVFPGNFIGNDLSLVPLSDFFVKKQSGKELSMEEFWEKDFDLQEAQSHENVAGCEWSWNPGKWIHAHDAYGNERCIHVSIVSDIHAWCRNLRIPYHVANKIFFMFWSFVFIRIIWIGTLKPSSTFENSISLASTAQKNVSCI
jgi:glycosylphosphatidylinositol transamidase (GPIT) subunit GPI8